MAVGPGGTVDGKEVKMNVTVGDSRLSILNMQEHLLRLKTKNTSL